MHHAHKERNAMNTKNLYERNANKEKLQDVILSFVYNTRSYNDLIFTGGTCLRKVYGLNRLSEDLDFDIPKDVSFDITEFAKDIKKYLSAQIKISGNAQTVFIKFPDNIFVRCDFTVAATATYQTQQSFITADNRQFLVLSYDLPTLWANKITAFLTRSFFKGKFQNIPFKGRDIYDMYWLLQLSAKTGYTLRPNVNQLASLLGTQSLDDIANQISEKLERVDPRFVIDDVSPLIDSPDMIARFAESFRDDITQQIRYILQE